MAIISMARLKESVRSSGGVEIGGGFQIAPAVNADHQAIHQLLSQVLHRPSAKEFQSQLDQPGYDPGQRLLIKQDGHLVAHLRLIPRRLHFGGLLLPAAYVTDLATVPKFCDHRCASMLLALAEHRIQRMGGWFGYLRTRNPAFYESLGWVALGESPHWTASPQAVLVQLRQRTTAVEPLVRPLRSVRRPRLAAGSRRSRSADTAEREAALPLLPELQRTSLHLHEFRYYEQEGLERLYAAHCRQAYGATLRDSDAWRWLIERRAFDRLYVASDGSPNLGLEQIPAAVVGYAVAARSRLFEVLADPRRPDAADALLARFCADAIEQNRYQIRLDAPVDSPSASWLPPIAEDFGKSGRWTGSGRSEEPVLMVRAISIPQLVGHLHGVFLHRLSQSGIRLPFELGFTLDGQTNVLRVTKAASQLDGEIRTRRCLACDQADFLRLLLGVVDIAEAAASGRITANSQTTLAAAQTLLPKTPLWFPPLDDLASGS
ncbi:MAG: GNAT family N-acetyltransferase [Pirellulaceae bacterium]|nr:GNAT family N-acetyltransferase [Pirellulaceae bacterium]